MHRSGDVRLSVPKECQGSVFSGWIVALHDPAEQNTRLQKGLCRPVPMAAFVGCDGLSAMQSARRWRPDDEAGLASRF
jgi:hypothetical protein